MTTLGRLLPGAGVGESGAGDDGDAGGAFGGGRTPVEPLSDNGLVGEPPDAPMLQCTSEMTVSLTVTDVLRLKSAESYPWLVHPKEMSTVHDRGTHLVDLLPLLFGQLREVASDKVNEKPGRTRPGQLPHSLHGEPLSSDTSASIA